MTPIDSEKEMLDFSLLLYNSLYYVLVCWRHRTDRRLITIQKTFINASMFAKENALLRWYYFLNIADSDMNVASCQL